jgi:hypothetical protein
VFSGGFFHRNVVLERLQEFLFFFAVTGIFRRNSCGTGIPVFTPRNPLDSGGFGGFLFPPKAAGSGQQLKKALC